MIGIVSNTSSNEPRPLPLL